MNNQTKQIKEALTEAREINAKSRTVIDILEAIVDERPTIEVDPPTTRSPGSMPPVLDPAEQYAKSMAKAADTSVAYQTTASWESVIWNLLKVTPGLRTEEIVASGVPKEEAKRVLAGWRAKKQIAFHGLKRAMRYSIPSAEAAE